MTLLQETSHSFDKRALVRVGATDHLLLLRPDQTLPVEDLLSLLRATYHEVVIATMDDVPRPTLRARPPSPDRRAQASRERFQGTFTVTAAASGSLSTTLDITGKNLFTVDQRADHGGYLCVTAVQHMLETAVGEALGGIQRRSRVLRVIGVGLLIGSVFTLIALPFAAERGTLRVVVSVAIIVVAMAGLLILFASLYPSERTHRRPTVAITIIYAASSTFALAGSFVPGALSQTERIVAKSAATGTRIQPADVVALAVAWGIVAITLVLVVLLWQMAALLLRGGPLRNLQERLWRNFGVFCFALGMIDLLGLVRRAFFRGQDDASELANFIELSSIVVFNSVALVLGAAAAVPQTRRQLRQLLRNPQCRSCRSPTPRGGEFASLAPFLGLGSLAELGPEEAIATFGTSMACPVPLTVDLAATMPFTSMSDGDMARFPARRRRRSTMGRTAAGSSTSGHTDDVSGLAPWMQAMMSTTMKKAMFSTQRARLLDMEDTEANAQVPRADAFIVHSWRDTNVTAKQLAIADWSRRFEAKHQRPPTVWLDMVIMDSSLRTAEQPLQGLLAIARSSRLVVLWGPTLLDRLWTVFQLYFWTLTGGRAEDVEVILLATDRDSVDRIVANVDAFHVMYAVAEVETHRLIFQDAVDLATPHRVNEAVRAYLPLVRAAHDARHGGE